MRCLSHSRNCSHPVSANSSTMKLSKLLQSNASQRKTRSPFLHGCRPQSPPHSWPVHRSMYKDADATVGCAEDAVAGRALLAAYSADEQLLRYCSTLQYYNYDPGTIIGRIRTIKQEHRRESLLSSGQVEKLYAEMKVKHGTWRANDIGDEELIETLATWPSCDQRTRSAC